MLDLGSFLAGIIFADGCGGGGSNPLKLSRSELNKRNEEYLSGNYSYAAQSRYDFNRGKLYSAYDVERIMEALREDYPRMNDLCAREVAEAAVAKRLFEEETMYSYKPSENCKFFDLEKYAKDEFKREEGKASQRRS